MATDKIHHLNITFSIVTKGSEPLVLDESDKEKLLVAFEVAVGRHVDLRYYPESRHIEEHHRFLGTEIVEGN